MLFCICMKLNLWIALDRLTGIRYWPEQRDEIRLGRDGGGCERANRALLICLTN